MPFGGVFRHEPAVGEKEFVETIRNVMYLKGGDDACFGDGNGLLLHRLVNRRAVL